MSRPWPKIFTDRIRNYEEFMIPLPRKRPRTRRRVAWIAAFRFATSAARTGFRRGVPEHSGRLRQESGESHSLFLAQHQGRLRHLVSLTGGRRTYFSANRTHPDYVPERLIVSISN